MNYLMNTKNLVKNSYLDSNKFLFTDRVTVNSSSDKTTFSKALEQARAQNGVNTSTNPSSHLLNAGTQSLTVKSGDTLSNIVRGYFAAQGQNISSTDAMQLAQVVARSNGIQNPDKIFPGQELNLSALSAQTVPSSGVNTAAYINTRSSLLSAQMLSGVGTRATQWRSTAPNLQTQVSQAIPGMQSSSTNLGGDNLVLNKTLERAVEKGFIPAEERSAVYNKIIDMSKTYQFHPDDFARLTLMESDGMNPKATNNRCHGIIQFCEGPDRGAASAGFATNAKDITSRSVLQQLDLVSKYFDETGLKNFGPAKLDDLYLTVLTPAARSETRAHANLNIAGAQASMLHVNRDTSAPITRHSIIEGLHQNAIKRLGLDFSETVVTQTATPDRTAANASVAAASDVSAQSSLQSGKQNSIPNLRTDLRAVNALASNNTNANASAQAIQLMQSTLMAQMNAASSQGGQNQYPSSSIVSAMGGVAGMGGLAGLASMGASGRTQVAQLQQAQLNASSVSTPVSSVPAQLSRVNSSVQSTPISQTQSPNTESHPGQRVQALRVSAYLNQTYLP